jgi:hypothetical protein
MAGSFATGSIILDNTRRQADFHQVREIDGSSNRVGLLEATDSAAYSRRPLYETHRLPPLQYCVIGGQSGHRNRLCIGLNSRHKKRARTITHPFVSTPPHVSLIYRRYPRSIRTSMRMAVEHSSRRAP